MGDDGPHRPLKDHAFLNGIPIFKLFLVPADVEISAFTFGSIRTKMYACVCFFVEFLHEAMILMQKLIFCTRRLKVSGWRVYRFAASFLFRQFIYNYVHIH